VVSNGEEIQAGNLRSDSHLSIGVKLLVMQSIKLHLRLLTPVLRPDGPLPRRTPVPQMSTRHPTLADLDPFATFMHRPFIDKYFLGFLHDR
jgi:hypothetical protein